MNYFINDSVEILKQFDSNIDTGLGKEAVEKNLEKFGNNELQEEERSSTLSKLTAQFKDFLILILIAASVISFMVGEKLMQLL